MESDLRPRADSLLRLAPSRRLTREVPIGNVVVGGRHPIVVQSMTTTRTADADATARQVIELARAGCEIVRVTVPSGPDAAALPEIRRIMAREGVRVPLVADIHFTPKLALEVIDHVEKVRVNPGNFADRKAVGGGDYDDTRWQQDIERLYALFAPVVDRARERGVALRIGTNHGSLSDRIVHRYGDSPEGMVQSALEFIQICEDRGHRGLVISMKSSNTQVMVTAYRLLSETLDRRGDAYPLHLGVTEAGGGDEGRMKSSVGIATLLAEGLGDTVRVSLTEDPIHEIPVATELIARFALPLDRPELPNAPELVESRNRLAPARRPTNRIMIGPWGWGGEDVPRVEVALEAAQASSLTALLMARPSIELVDIRVDSQAELGSTLQQLARVPKRRVARGITLHGASISILADASSVSRLKANLDRVAIVVDLDNFDLPAMIRTLEPLPVLMLLPVAAPWNATSADRIVTFARALSGHSPAVQAGLIFDPHADNLIEAHRLLATALDRSGAALPIVLNDLPSLAHDPRVGMAGRFGALLIDGLGDGVRVPIIESPSHTVHLAHGILQAARCRLERAEYIACPSCGRTLFDLETTTQRIRDITSHLKLKIAVMGCVVNGPGEMADADFGFVGWGEGKVALFVGKKLVTRDVPFAEAPGKLVDLIREHGRWTDPEPSAVAEAEQSVN
ncbi:MAG: (E)-4-hydroxy-3-methylbut-2-enyl-diphosphate synthase [Acidobacteriota bacterium]